MLQRIRRGSFLVMIAVFFLGCDISLDERCGKGDKFVWNPENNKCMLQDTETETDDSKTDTDGEFPVGLGEPCTVQGDCEGYEAHHCNATDLRPSGYCTIQDCAPQGCPKSYKCCDCTGAGFGISCTKDADASAAENYMKCVCE